MSRVQDQNAQVFEAIPYGPKPSMLIDRLARRIAVLEDAQVRQAQLPQLNNAGIENLLRDSDFNYSTNAYTGAGSTDEVYSWVKGVNPATPITNATTGVKWDKTNGWLEWNSKLLTDDLSYHFPKRLLLDRKSVV